MEKNCNVDLTNINFINNECIYTIIDTQHIYTNTELIHHAIIFLFQTDDHPRVSKKILSLARVVVMYMCMHVSGNITISASMQPGCVHVHVSGNITISASMQPGCVHVHVSL